MTQTPFEIFSVSGLDNTIKAFKTNFHEYDELGAQFCLMRDVGVYSSGKAIAALVIAYLVEEDRLGYNQLASTLWSGFEQETKLDTNGLVGLG